MWMAPAPGIYPHLLSYNVRSGPPGEEGALPITIEARTSDPLITERRHSPSTDRLPLRWHPALLDLHPRHDDATGAKAPQVYEDVVETSLSNPRISDWGRFLPLSGRTASGQEPPCWRWAEPTCARERQVDGTAALAPLNIAADRTSRIAGDR